MSTPRPNRRSGLSVAAFMLLLLMCFSYEARGDDDDDDWTQEEDLSPGIKLRIESCGYDERPNQVRDDDDSAGDDDDDSAGI